MTSMVNVYVELIKAGRREISSVPISLRTDVERALAMDLGTDGQPKE
ncbi:CD1375 family protein [Paenibacillus sp. FJAT-26967]|nr:CD1375 family protein [Paenibacillus sp. FJAT-26967]